MTIATSKDYKKHHIAIAHIRCKLWKCDYCSQKNRSQWRAVLYKRLPEISPYWSFHTFTTGSHKTLTIAQSEQIIMKNWERLIKRLARVFGKFSYVRTIELHKSGQPHIHALFSILVPDITWIKTKKTKQNKTCGYWHSPIIAEHLKECDFGIIQSSENLQMDTDNGHFQALGYATKYMTKREDNPIHKFRIRFIQTSRDIKLNTLEASQNTWIIKSGIYEHEVLAIRHIDLSRDNRSITADDFEDCFIYPSELFLTDD